MSFYELPLELRTLRGPLITRLTDTDFLQLRQANPHLTLERDADRHIIIMPPAHLDAAQLPPRPASTTA